MSDDLTVEQKEAALCSALQAATQIVSERDAALVVERETVNLLSADNDALQEETTKLQRQIEDSYQLLSERDGQIEVLETQLAGTQADLAALEAELAQAKQAAPPPVPALGNENEQAE